LEERRKEVIISRHRGNFPGRRGGSPSPQKAFFMRKKNFRGGTRTERKGNGFFDSFFGRREKGGEELSSPKRSLGTTVREGGGGP